MALSFRKTPPSPDQDALVRIGTRVRARLEADPHVHKLPVEGAEVFAMGAFLDPGECFRLVTMIDGAAQPSTLFSDVTLPDYRTSYSANVDPYDSVVQMIQRRIDDLLGMPPEWGETIQGQRYEPGQQYREHCDWFPYESQHWKTERKRGGQRSWTAMIFLNDVEEGGKTAFPNLGLEVTPQRGALLMWNNATVEGLPNRLTLHAGRPPVKGTKHIITKWYRCRKWG